MTRAAIVGVLHLIEDDIDGMDDWYEAQAASLDAWFAIWS